MDGGLLSLKWNNHRSSFIHMLSSLRKKDVYCDVTLACDGKFYPTHKLVLSTCSEYFQEMFQHTDCKHPIIVLKDMKSDDLESLLNYMYMGEVNILQEKLSTLIKAAECLKIKGLAVPDDPPGEKRSSTNDSNPDSKRRKTDSDYQKSKDVSRSHSHKSTKSPDRYYKSGASASGDSFIPQKEQFPCDSQSYDYSSEQSAAGNFGRESTVTNKELKDEQAIFIKQEPSENVIDLEDSKEGILESSHAAFADILPQVDSSKSDNVEISDAQNIWGSESHSSDSYRNFDADNPANANEEDQNESVSWKRNIARIGTLKTQSWTTSFQDTKQRRRDCSNQDTDRLEMVKPQRKFTCPMCSKMFPHKGNLRKHIQTHTGEKPFYCSYCNYQATQKIHVLVHMKRIHKK